MAELPKLPNLLEPVELEDEEENTIPKFEGLLSEDQSQTPQQKSFAELMPGNTTYKAEDAKSAVDTVKSFGSFMKGLFAPDDKNESTIKNQYDDYEQNRGIDTFSGAAVDYDQVVNADRFIEPEDITVQNVTKKAGTIASNLLNTMAGSGASLGGGVAHSIDMLIDLSLGEDKETIFEKYGEGSQQFAQERFEAGAWEDNLNVIESVKQGRIGEAISKAIQGAIQNSAQLLTITGMGLMGGSVAGGAAAGKALSAVPSYLSGLGATASSQAPLALITASAAGGKYASLDDRDDLSIDQKVTSGLLSGALEAVTEIWGSLRYLDDIANSVPGIDRTIRSELMRYARSLIDPKKLAANGLSEAKEEYIAEFGNALFDSIMGISDKTIPEVLADQEPYLNSAAVGFTSGLGMSGVGQLAQFNQVSQVNQDITNRQQKADQFINYVEEGSKFNLSDETKQKLWQQAVDVNDPAAMYNWYQTAEQSIENNEFINFEEASEFLDSWFTNKEYSGDLTTKLQSLGQQQEETQEEETTETITNPLEVSDDEVKISEGGDSAFSDLTDQELRGLREGMSQEIELTNEPALMIDIQAVEAEMDNRGLDYERFGTQDTEQGQIEEQDTTEVEEPAEAEESEETDYGEIEIDLEFTEEEQELLRQDFSTLGFDDLMTVRNLLETSRQKLSEIDAVPQETINSVEIAIQDVDNRLAEVAAEDDSSMVRNDNVNYSLEEAFKEAEANGENLTAEELIGRANERLVEQGEDPITSQEMEENDILGEWERTLELNEMLPEETAEETETVEVEDETTELETTEEVESEEVTTEQELTVEEIEGRIDDLFFELEEAETETEEIEIREQIDTLEQQLNEMVDTEQEVVDESGNELEVNVGYHAGDLGKGETFVEMDSGRGTGHYGTGTYFVGSQESLENTGKTDRPVQEISFDNYNLYKPADKTEGFKLHDFLRDINRYAFEGEFATEEMSLDESRGKPYQDELLETKNELFPDMSDGEFLNQLEGLRQYVEANQDLNTEEQSQLDTPSTMFMKTLGYEGIDVRGMEGLDNTQYGSVIYDLNQETETELSEEDKQSIKEEELQLSERAENIDEVVNASIERVVDLGDNNINVEDIIRKSNELLEDRGMEYITEQEMSDMSLDSMIKDTLRDEGILEESVETEVTEETVETEGPAINFNSATREDLMNIDGIGSTTADRIIEFRANNQFNSPEDLLKVKGIGQSTLSKLENLNLDFTNVEIEDTADSTETIEEPTDSEITTDEDLTAEEQEAENLDVDEVASEVDDVEGTVENTDELLSEEARDLMEFDDTDIREYLDVVQFTSLEDLASVTEAERADIISEIEEDDPDIAEAIRAELEERGYGPSDFYAKKYNKSNQAKQRENARNVLSDGDTDGTFEGVEPATRRQIENIIRKDLGIPLRYGKLQSRDSEAQYDSVYKVIRTRDYSNMEVTAHEVGHYLSQMLDLDVDAFPELAQLLQDEGLAEYYNPLIWHEEGNSEFFKYYFNNPGQAKLKAPAYFDYVESVIQGSELYENIKALQNRMATWNMQSAEERVSGAMSRQGLEIRSLLSTKDKITEALVDEDIVMKESLEQAGYDVANMPAYKNPWKLKRLFASVNDIVHINLIKQQTDPAGRRIGKPLLEILKPVEDYIGETDGREFGDFEVYSLALHALEREAKFLARDLESRGNKKGKIAAKRINAVIEDANIEALINTLQMADNNPGQLESLGLQLETGEYQFRATGININDIADTVTKYDSALFRNTMKDLQNFQNNLVDYAEYYGMLSSEAAENIKATYNFHMPMQREFGEELVSEGQDTIRYVDLPEVVQSAYGSTRIIKDPLRSLVRDTSYIIRQSNKNNITTKFMQALDAKADSGVGYMVGREITVPEPINEENVVSYRINGETKSRVVHPDIYRALQGMNKEESHVLRTLLKPLEYSNSLFKRFAVINPKFWLNNLGRDEVRQMIYEDANGIEKLKLFSTFIDGFASSFGMNQQDTENIFRALGGARGGFAQYLKDIDNPETLNELMAADKTSKNPLTWLGDVAQATEDMRRLGLFNRKVGTTEDINSMSVQEAEKVLKEAAYFGKGEVLEDYSIKGRWTKEIDRYAAPFSAAGVTGARHLYNKLKQPSTWLNGILYVTMPALALWARNRDKPEYQELPAWKKMLYFNYVKDNGEIISFPKPFITGYFFGAIPEMLADYSYNKNGQELVGNLKTIVQAGAPNYQMAGGIAAGYEVLTNRADPLGDDYPIVPDSEKYLANEDQYGEYNSEFAKGIGSMFNMSPRIIDHLMEGQFTGTYSMATNIIDYFAGAKDFKEATLGIVGVYSDPFITSTTVNNLYQKREKYNNSMSRLREQYQLKQRVDMDAAEITEVATKYSQLNDITNVMAKYRNISNIIDSLDIDPELKDNARKYLSIENINLARNYYGRELIYLDDLMTPEEVQRINDLITWIQNNY